MENNNVKNEEIKNLENENSNKNIEKDKEKEAHHKKRCKHKEDAQKLSHSDLLKEYENLLNENEKLKTIIEEKENIIKEKQKHAEEYLDKYKRSLAEMENLRKRVTLEKQDFLKYANFNIISDLLVILDDFERAIENGKSGVSDINNYIQGIDMIEKQFIDLLFKKYGVKKYGEKGEEFDPNIHQALMMEDGEIDKESISEVFRKGYMLHDRVIRPAQVKIIRPKIVNIAENNSNNNCEQHKED